MTDIKEWINSLPLFTRYWLLTTVGVTLFARFGILSPSTLTLSYFTFIEKFEIWRAVTALFYYPLNPSTGFHFMVNCYFLYQYSVKLERGEFEGRPADYFFMLIFNWLCCVVLGVIIRLPSLMDMMILSVLYVWCQFNQDVIVNFWFGTKFKAMYFPWVLLAFNLIVSGGGTMEFFGIIIGHIYFFLKFQYPQEYDGPELLQTPRFLESYFPPYRVNVHGYSNTNDQRPTQTPTGRNIFGGHYWGQGQTLGQ